MATQKYAGLIRNPCGMKLLLPGLKAPSGVSPNGCPAAADRGALAAANSGRAAGVGGTSVRVGAGVDAAAVDGRDITPGVRLCPATKDSLDASAALHPGSAVPPSAAVIPQRTWALRVSFRRAVQTRTRQSFKANNISSAFPGWKGRLNACAFILGLTWLSQLLRRSVQAPTLGDFLFLTKKTHCNLKAGRVSGVQGNSWYFAHLHVLPEDAFHL